MPLSFEEVGRIFKEAQTRWPKKSFAAIDARYLAGEIELRAFDARGISEDLRQLFFRVYKMICWAALFRSEEAYWLITDLVPLVQEMIDTQSAICAYLQATWDTLPDSPALRRSPKHIVDSVALSSMKLREDMKAQFALNGGCLISTYEFIRMHIAGWSFYPLVLGQERGDAIREPLRKIAGYMDEHQRIERATQHSDDPGIGQA